MIAEKAELKKKRLSAQVSRWQTRTKLKLIAYKGGKCENCGYDKIQYPRAFVFHHKNPEEKEFSLGSRTISFAALQAEADKCVLLCQNCHNESHEAQWLLAYKNGKPEKKRRLNKRTAVLSRGGCCQVCGYHKTDFLSVFHFHSEKSFSVSQYDKADLALLLAEIEKCLLVCANCHAEIHDEALIDVRTKNQAVQPVQKQEGKICNREKK